MATAIIREDAQRDSTPKGAKETRRGQRVTRKCACACGAWRRYSAAQTPFRSVHTRTDARPCSCSCAPSDCWLWSTPCHTCRRRRRTAPCQQAGFAANKGCSTARVGHRHALRGSRCALNARPYSWQACGRSPVCVRICWMRSWLLANERVQRKHSRMRGRHRGDGGRLKVQSLKLGPSKVIGSSAPSREGMSVALAKQRQRPT